MVEAPGKSFYYVRPDKAMRPWQVWRHVLGTPAARDQLVFQEDDERFFVSVDLTRSTSFVLITSESKMSTEVRYLRSDSDRGHLSVVLPRREGVEYDVDHAVDPANGDIWLVRSNRGPGRRRTRELRPVRAACGGQRPRPSPALAPVPAGGEGRVRRRLCPARSRPRALGRPRAA